MSYMNRSGYPLLKIAQFYKIQPPEILVVLDDMALPLGRLRLRASGGSGGHNGLESVIVQFGTEEIPRLRIGIGEAPPAASVDYVLSRFFEEEKPIVRSTQSRKSSIDWNPNSNKKAPRSNKCRKWTNARFPTQPAR